MLNSELKTKVERLLKRGVDSKGLESIIAILYKEIILLNEKLASAPIPERKSVLEDWDEAYSVWWHQNAREHRLEDGSVDKSSLPYLIKYVIRSEHNPNFNQDATCRCGHKYYRHFDTYEGMRPIGCKYCDCYKWTAPK